MGPRAVVQKYKKLYSFHWIEAVWTMSEACYMLNVVQFPCSDLNHKCPNWWTNVFKYPVSSENCTETDFCVFTCVSVLCSLTLWTEEVSTPSRQVNNFHTAFILIHACMEHGARNLFTCAHRWYARTQERTILSDSTEATGLLIQKASSALTGLRVPGL